MRMPGSVSARGRRHVSAVCLAFGLLAAPLAVNAQGHVSARFGKWHTFCDKDLLCAAYTYSGTEQNPSSGHVFTLERPQDGGGWAMSLTLDAVEPRLSLGLQASVIRYGHDQAPIPPFPNDALALEGGRQITGTAGTHTLHLSGASGEAVMQRLRLGDILDFEFGGCRDEFLYANFSLAGITAALAWIDERQGLPEGSTRIAALPADRAAGASSNCGE